MNYAQQSAQPDWYESDESKIYLRATSGSHFQNQWYEFDGVAQAHNYAAQNFRSQSFVDEFCQHADGLFYNYDQFDPASMESAVDSGGYVLKDGAQPVGLAEMIDAASPF